MAKIIIVGGGGLGREVFAWLVDTLGPEKKHDIAGFLDANPLALDRFGNFLPVLGDPEQYEPMGDELFVCALGNPKIKKIVCSKLLNKGARFFTLVHPTAVVGPRCTLGEGVVICPGVILTSDVEVGAFALINAQATAGHDSIIGPWSTLSGHVDIAGFAKLGEGVFLGSHASILPKAQVGDFATVGAGSVVVRKVKPNVTVFGVPAKQIAGF